MTNQTQIMQSQYLLSSDQAKLEKSKNLPHFEINGFYTRDPKSGNVQGTNLLIRKDGNFAASVVVDQYTLISTKTHTGDPDHPLVEIGVYNFYGKRARDSKDTNTWYLTSENNLEILELNNKVLAGKMYKNEILEPLTAVTYLKISYRNLYDENVVEYYLIDDFNMKKLSEPEGEAALKRYEKNLAPDIYQSLTNKLISWVKENCA